MQAGQVCGPRGSLALCTLRSPENPGESLAYGYPTLMEHIFWRPFVKEDGNDAI